jgi:hypothetical protein
MLIAVVSVGTAVLAGRAVIVGLLESGSQCSATRRLAAARRQLIECSRGRAAYQLKPQAVRRPHAILVPSVLGPLLRVPQGSDYLPASPTNSRGNPSHQVQTPLYRVSPPARSGSFSSSTRSSDRVTRSHVLEPEIRKRMKAAVGSSPRAGRTW